MSAVTLLLICAGFLFLVFQCWLRIRDLDERLDDLEEQLHRTLYPLD